MGFPLGAGGGEERFSLSWLSHVPVWKAGAAA
jgi:hypothetical protein